MFPFPIIAPSEISLVSAYASAQFDGANLTTYTYNSQGVGSGDWLIVGCAYNSGAFKTISSVTVGGSGMSKISEDAVTSGISFWRIAHPGTATADIVVTASGACSRGVMGVWTITGTPNSWTPVDTWIGGTDTTIDLQAGGCFFGIATDGTAGADTWTSPPSSADASAQLGGDAQSGVVSHYNATVTQAGVAVTTSAGGHRYAISLR